MNFGRQTIGSVAQLLAALSADAVDVLLYKHLGVYGDHYGYGMRGYLEGLKDADADSVTQLVSELIRESATIRANALSKYVFDGRLRELERWLLHDGWAVEDGRLVRLAPGAEEVTGVRDRLLEDFEASDLDEDGAIRKCIEDAADSFVKEPPDYNDSATKIRIALETTARRAATRLAAKGATVYAKDSWGKALEYLRQNGVLGTAEEETVARVYTFISPGTHVPTGVTEEEWARLARTFGLGACYFLLKKYQANS